MKADWEREALTAVEDATRNRVITHKQMVLIVAQTLEPLIRASEYEMCSKRLDDMDYFMTNQRKNLMSSLYGKVEALPGKPNGRNWIRRDQVLDIIDGSGE